MTTVTIKSILPSGRLKTKLIIINYNTPEAYLQIVILMKDLKNSRDFVSPL